MDEVLAVCATKNTELEDLYRRTEATTVPRFPPSDWVDVDAIDMYVVELNTFVTEFKRTARELGLDAESIGPVTLWFNLNDWKRHIVQCTSISPQEGFVVRDAPCAPDQLPDPNMGTLCESRITAKGRSFLLVRPTTMTIYSNRSPLSSVTYKFPHNTRVDFPVWFEYKVNFSEPVISHTNGKINETD